MDGHFSAEHLKMRNPEDDVNLTDGAGFMTQDAPYKEHLRVAREAKDVRMTLFRLCRGLPRHNFRDRLATITRRSIRLTQIGTSLRRLVSGERHALAMAALFQGPSLIFKRVNSKKTWITPSHRLWRTICRSHRRRLSSTTSCASMVSTSGVVLNKAPFYIYPTEFPLTGGLGSSMSMVTKIPAIHDSLQISYREQGDRTEK